MIFAGLSGLVAVAAGWLVTWRLFALARRTRAVPERLLALAFGGLFCVGYPLAGASRAPGLALTHEGSLLFAMGAIGMVVGVSALGRFPYVVFRPDTPWARGLAVLIAVSGSAGGIGCAVAVTRASTQTEMVRNIQVWALALVGAVFAAYLWNALESLRYYGNMKRRVALGLATRETTHRFLLWALASGASVVSLASIMVIRASGGAILDPIPMAIISCTTFVTTTCWCLAFFMPESYRRGVLGAEPGDPTERREST